MKDQNILNMEELAREAQLLHIGQEPHELGEKEEVSNEGEFAQPNESSQIPPTDALSLNIEYFLCPITLDFMKDPVCSKYGHTFEREAIVDWIHKHHSCPITSKPLKEEELFPCYSMKSATEELFRNHPHLSALVHPSVNLTQSKIPKATDNDSNTNKTTLQQQSTQQLQPQQPQPQQQEQQQQPQPPPTQHSELPLNQSQPSASQPGPRLTNLGLVQILPKCRNAGVREASARKLYGNNGVDWWEQTNEENYGKPYIGSTFLTFPAPDSLLSFFSATGYICLQNVGKEGRIVLISHQTVPLGGGKTRMGGSFVLKAGQSQGFDIRGQGWFVEVREGDASRLLVHDFSTRGGGKGDRLGMCTD